MKIVVFGCQQIAVDILESFENINDIEISLVITYELPLDKTYGYKSVIQYCKNKNIDYMSPKSVNHKVIQKISDISPDLILSLYYRKILPKKLINLPHLGCINIHPSKLPYYRGPVPTAWAIENGETEFGVTIHYMDESIDTGDVLVQKSYKIGDEETGYELYTRAMKLGANLFKNNFDKIINKKIKPVPQKGIGSYYGKKSGRFFIDWQMPLDQINNKIRVHAKPFNSTETLLFNRYVLVNKAKRYNGIRKSLQGPGVIKKVLKNDQFIVSCVDGYLLIQDYEIVPKLTIKEKKIYLKEGNSFG